MGELWLPFRLKSPTTSTSCQEQEANPHRRSLFLRKGATLLVSTGLLTGSYSPVMGLGCCESTLTETTPCRYSLIPVHILAGHRFVAAAISCSIGPSAEARTG